MQRCVAFADGCVRHCIDFCSLAAVSPFRTVPQLHSTHGAPRRIPSGSLAFRERLPQSADSRRFDGFAEANLATASAVRVVGRSGDS